MEWKTDRLTDRPVCCKPKSKERTPRSEGSDLILWNGDNKSMQGSDGIGFIRNERAKIEIRKCRLVSSWLLCVCRKVGNQTLLVACYAPARSDNGCGCEFGGRLCNAVSECNPGRKAVLLVT